MLRSVVVLFLLLALPLRANLGENVEQLVKRYGAPGPAPQSIDKTPFITLVFVAKPYALLIFLLNNVEVGARVSKVDKSGFSDAEMKTIMDADAPAPWVPAANPEPNTLQWTRADKATLIYDKDKKMLIFTAPEMDDALHGKMPPPAAPPPKPPMVN